MSDPREPKVSFRDVHIAFGAKKVLQGINLDVMPGESVVVIGGSGTGKSVMLKCMLGLLNPSQGSIKIAGQEIVGISDRAREPILRKFGMLFQYAALFDSLPVWENVAFGLTQAKGVSRVAARPIAIRKLAQVGLGADVADLSPSELSGGMKKRVGLARAIATDPEVILFDEPTTGLDPIMGDVINDLIVDCVKSLGATAVSITHDMASARKIGDRVAMLHQGKIVWQGPAKTIETCDNPYVQQFIHGRAEGPIKMEVRPE
ncbi:MAG: ATP-binding cassette domain-containing protein [Alphaproteobacteria bacterium]|nr:ATP-binding cassette domain-containing protein [Alphaproteobacteria bacterium]